MPTRRKTQEFIDHYDRLSQIYGDPIKVLFEIAFDERTFPSDRRAAASDLMSYRYPKQKSIDLTLDLQNAVGVSFVMIAPGAQEKLVNPTAQEEFGMAEGNLPVKPALELVK